MKLEPQTSEVSETSEVYSHPTPQLHIVGVLGIDDQHQLAGGDLPGDIARFDAISQIA
jgi:hypothetical protein